MKQGHFEKYVNIIRKRAHYYSRCFGIEYEELESQGFEIYVNALDKYDISKSSFSTYLYIELNRLKDYCISYKNKFNDVAFYEPEDKAGEDPDKDEQDCIIRNYEMVQLRELLEDAKSILSTPAYDLFDWICSWQWEKKYITKPTITVATKYFNKPRPYIEELWNECKNYWNSNGYSLYY